ncbi:tRNA glutamyl-Q(34) synthetase GluQRS [Lacimicrobium alkaliphilum]|uniref:Glutamyl-Q tRNA(Asp) synthetase n=1 Tax=Lacimicrobium alkaliphilum TaxID=1526571 RepID=A0A0U2ZDM1_9ALTE|nr:tRNA glutamyl-Q(34) synthetase GluQRS [Lacimicrobium alkaliphilum]ALS97223.1 glutamyl-Q tRNA(Asp) ligase [Lacimicrobium alkaliphilum]
MVYTGRFAPSPSGPLHFGSLVAALGSYLRAKSQSGNWLVRIEDIDPPREQPGAADVILRTLEVHGLAWDGEVSYQSRFGYYYDEILDYLAQRNLSYYCNCTRAQIKALGGRYQGICRDRQHAKEDCALRFRNNHPVYGFTDQHLGLINVDPATAAEDFIIRRKDGLYAYQLAVVADDIRQGITEVVRGADLLDTTTSQIALYHALGEAAPDWLHLPVAAVRPGFKLSKQNHAPAIDDRFAVDNLRQALMFLGVSEQQAGGFDRVETLLQWARGQWSLLNLTSEQEVLWPQPGTGFDRLSP